MCKLSASPQGGAWYPRTAVQACGVSGVVDTGEPLHAAGAGVGWMVVPALPSWSYEDPPIVVRVL